MNDFEKYIKPISARYNEIIYNLNDIYNFCPDADLSKFLSIGKVWTIYSGNGIKYCTVTKLNEVTQILLMYKKSLSNKDATIQIYTGNIGTRIKIILETRRKIKDIL